MPVALIDASKVGVGCWQGLLSVTVTVAERGVPRLEQANGAILKVVAEHSRRDGKVRKRRRSVCAQTDLESPPNTHCASQGVVRARGNGNGKGKCFEKGGPNCSGDALTEQMALKEMGNSESGSEREWK